MPPWVLPMLPDGVALTVAPHIQAGKTLGYRNTRYVHGFDVFRGVIVSVKSFGAMVVTVVINTEGHALVGLVLAAEGQLAPAREQSPWSMHTS